jgi:DNA-binding cell septation regulator SpoVG
MAAAVGSSISATFLDARDDGDGMVRSAWEFGQDEGFVIRNVVLQGASGVFSMMVTLEWDEVTL